MKCPGNDWHARDGYRACNYCGSMHPEDLFAAIEAGAQIDGTDKNYKIYVNTPHPDAEKPCVLSSANYDFGGGAIKVTDENVNTLPLDDYQRKHYNDGSHWVRIQPRPPMAHAKFYFYHFDEAQMIRFIELYNTKKLNLEPMFGLYRMPYFMARKD